MPILDINEIRTILPHRYPFLLVDRIVVPEPAELMQPASELADARQHGLVRSDLGHLNLLGSNREVTTIEHFRLNVH